MGRILQLAAGVVVAVSTAAIAQRAQSSAGHASAPVRVAAPSARHVGGAVPAPRYSGPVHATGAGHPVPAARNSGSGYGTSASHLPYRPAAATARPVANVNARSRSAGRPGNPRNTVRLYAISPVGWWLGPHQFYPWLDADLSYDYWHDTGDADTAIATAATGADMVADAPPWPGGDADANAAAEPDADSPVGFQATQLDAGAPALTLVFKDGHTEQVANYVISRTAVTVIDDGGVRSVPVAELDVAQMDKVNGQAGLQLPSAGQ